MADLRARIGPLELKNPVLTASGTCGYGLDLEPLLDPTVLGGICTKGLSLEPREGAPPPRVWETPCGLLNAIGLANVGIEAFLANELPPLHQRGVTVIVNVLGETPEDFSRLSRRLDGAQGVAAIELNLSCPNVKAGGVHMGRVPSLAAQAVRAARRETELPLLAKLPAEGDVVAVALAAEEAGATAISVCNTLRGMAIDVETRRPRLGSVYGGLSGPAIRPVAVRVVHEVSGRVTIPVVGIGGVSTWQDAVEMMLAGAVAVQVGTALLVDPGVPVRIIQGLAAYLDSTGEAAGDIVRAVRSSG